LHYVADPTGFGGFDATVADVALQEYQDARRELEEAQRELAATTEPPFTRVEALGDTDRWAKVVAYETIRDKVDELLGQENRARQKAEDCGHIIPPMGEGVTFAGDPFRVQPYHGSSKGVLTTT
jgi:hypothetical protein